MAEGKKSFILYVDQRGTFNKLSDEQAGKLIKHIFAYVSDEQPEADFITELAFEGIKTTLKRDLKKYENYIDKQRENGSKGGRPPKPKKPKPFFENPSEPKKADSVSDSDSDSVSDSVSVSDSDNVSVTVSNSVITKSPTREDIEKEICNNLFQRGIASVSFPVEALAQRFYDNYETKGWEINGQRMYKWQPKLNQWISQEISKKDNKLETDEERRAREFMEEIKRQAVNESLYGTKNIGNV